MRPGDRLICALVKSQAVGFRFREWPLHITIVPWFRLDLTSAELAENYSRSLVGSHPFEVRVGESTQFGYKKRKQVNLVQAPELIRLEGQTRRFLHSHKAWVVDEADKTRRHFRPHITVQSGERSLEGDSLLCERLYVVVQHGDYKKIEISVNLAR
jgi:2'-5' RNA ligase